MKSLEETQNYYNGISKGYSNLYHQEQIEKIQEVNSYFISLGKILDLGAGDGVLNQFIDSSCELFSIDLSEELLKLNSNDMSRKFVGNVEKLSFEDNSFDMICSFSMLQDVPDIQKAVYEIQRVGKSGCRCIISFVRWGSRVEEMKKLLKQISKETVFEKELEKDYVMVFSL